MKRDHLKHLGFATASAIVASLTKTPPPMTLPQETIDKINKLAAYYSGFSEDEDHTPLSKGKYYGYHAAATEWAGKAQPVLDALEQIQNSPTPNTLNEMEFWIEAARNLSAIALAKYKEVSNG